MSMGLVNRAFAAALGTKGTSNGCVMTYGRDATGKQQQLLLCSVTLPSGSLALAKSTVDGRADLVAAAEKLAHDFKGA